METRECRQSSDLQLQLSSRWSAAPLTGMSGGGVREALMERVPSPPATMHRRITGAGAVSGRTLDYGAQSRL